MYEEYIQLDLRIFMLFIGISWEIYMAHGYTVYRVEG